MKFDIQKYNPCKEGIKYYENKASFEEAWNDCDRGDWMLWIAYKLGVDDRTLTRAKALCANTIRHIIRDKRSTGAIDAALRYADGEISRNELYKYKIAATDIYAANAANYGDAAAAADTYSAAAAVYAAAAIDAAVDAYAAAAAIAVDAAAAAAAVAADTHPAAVAAAVDVAKKTNRLATANICREALTKAVFDKVKNL